MIFLSSASAASFAPLFSFEPSFPTEFSFLGFFFDGEARQTGHKKKMRVIPQMQKPRLAGPETQPPAGRAGMRASPGHCNLDAASASVGSACIPPCVLMARDWVRLYPLCTALWGRCGAGHTPVVRGRSEGAEVYSCRGCRILAAPQCAVPARHPSAGRVEPVHPQACPRWQGLPHSPA